MTPTQLPAIKPPSLPTMPTPPAMPPVVHSIQPPAVKPATETVDGQWRRLPEPKAPSFPATVPPLQAPAPSREMQPQHHVAQRAGAGPMPRASYRPSSGGGALFPPLGILDSVMEALGGFANFLALDWLFGSPGGRRQIARKPVALIYYAVPLDDKQIVVQRLLMDEVRMRPEESIETDHKGQMSQFVFSVPVYHKGMTERALIALKVEWSEL